MVMGFKNYLWLTALLIVLATSCQLTSVSKKESADLIITGAKIFTSDKQQPWAEALAIKDGKFIYVGDAVITGSTGSNVNDLVMCIILQHT
jgi:glycerate-2-kinase